MRTSLQGGHAQQRTTPRQGAKTGMSRKEREPAIWRNGGQGGQRSQPPNWPAASTTQHNNTQYILNKNYFYTHTIPALQEPTRTQRRWPKKTLALGKLSTQYPETQTGLSPR